MKNRVIEINDDIVAIEILYKGTQLLCYINREDLEKVSSIRGTWHITRNIKGHLDGVRTKIQVNKIRRQVWLHNFIFDKVSSDNVVDHIDHNTLNNVRSNLREVTKEQNSQNISTTLSKSVTKCRNVTMERGKYRVRIGGRPFGFYNSLHEAREVAIRKRRIVFPISSELDNKVTI
jgi:hypothetical protein